MSDQEQNNEPAPFHREGDAIVFDKPPSTEEAARQRRENEQHEFARAQVKTNTRIAWFNGLLVIATFCTIGVGIWQGIISHRAADAAKDAADASCIAAQVARSTLIEYQKSAEDSHLASVASYAQALVAMQSQKSFVDADFTVPGNRPYGQPLELLYHLKNIGRSDASNVRMTGWVTVARPNSGETSKKLPKGLVSMQKNSIMAGEQFFPDIAGTARDGNPHGVYIPAVDAEGNPIVYTMELDKAIFTDHKLTIFWFYTISYEDFTARYTRNGCGVYFVFGPDPRAMSAADFDKQCNAYNTQTEVQKIPMPAPSKPVPADKFPEINCALSQKNDAALSLSLIQRLRSKLDQYP